MAGHSHSANIKHRKNAVDAKRAKIFNKLARNIMSAARGGGPDMDTNLKLKYAVEKARAANMPKDNIERVMKRAAGGKEGADFEELTYEGYAPGGVA
ncbi:MAG: YebC/PmpR family DNA-binding transcriptional regulator, partial [Planctomycetota bacterium]|nr:YebC/PmpR family DNA-binding transcriptional regulator [Planctomycetota bacterium]